MAFETLFGNLAVLKRLIAPAAYKTYLFDKQYASKAEEHAYRSESLEEQAQIISWIQASSLKTRRVLDVGCNTGKPLDYICAALECEGVGVDVNLAAIAAAQRQFPNRQFAGYDGITLSFNDHSFDHVLLHHVLGHVKDPEATVREIVRVLRPRGTLSIITTNTWYQFWQTPLNILNGFQPDQTVLRYYSVRTLRYLLRKHGLTINTLTTWKPSKSPQTPRQHSFCKLRLMAFASKS